MFTFFCFYFWKKDLEFFSIALVAAGKKDEKYWIEYIIYVFCKFGSFLICILIFQYALVLFFPSPILQFPLLETIFSLPFCCLLFMLIEHQKLICKLVIHSACAFLHHNGRSSNLNSSWVSERAIPPMPFNISFLNV